MKLRELRDKLTQMLDRYDDGIVCVTLPTDTGAFDIVNVQFVDEWGCIEIEVQPEGSNRKE